MSTLTFTTANTLSNSEKLEATGIPNNELVNYIL